MYVHCKFIFKGEIYYGIITGEYEDYYIIRVNEIPHYFFKEDVEFIYKMSYER